MAIMYSFLIKYCPSFCVGQLSRCCPESQDHTFFNGFFFGANQGEQEGVRMSVANSSAIDSSKKLGLVIICWWNYCLRD